MSIPDVTVEVAFATAPDDPSPAWVDVSDRVDLAAGLSIVRGRADEFSQVQPSRCTLTLDNADGRFTAQPGPFVQRTNLLTNPSFETDQNGWSAARGTLARASASGAYSGSITSRYTADGTAGGNYIVTSIRPNVVGGQTYTFSMYGRQLSGGSQSWSADLTWFDASGAVIGSIVLGTPVLLGASFDRVSNTATAPSNAASVQCRVLNRTGTMASGQIAEFDAALLEQSSTLGSYFDGDTADTTDAAGFGINYQWTGTANASTSTQGRTSPYYPGVKIGRKIRVFTGGSPTPRFTGYVDEWPVEWAPTGLWAKAEITATDRFKRLGQIAAFSNVIAEEVAQATESATIAGPRPTAATAYYMLGEDSQSTTFGDTSANNRPPLQAAQIGTGGTFEAATATGPGTDGMSAPQFTPASATSGYYLTGPTDVALDVGALGLTLAAAFNTASAATQTIARISNADGSVWAELRVQTGNLVFEMADDRSGLTAGQGNYAVADGHTHDAVVTIDNTTGVMHLYVDGVERNTSPGWSDWWAQALLAGSYQRLWVAGSAAGQLLTGTVSHVTTYNAPLDATSVARRSAMVLTGGAGESSDARIARYARWAGMAAADYNLEAGDSQSIAHVDTTGKAPLAAMQDVAATESGILFVAGDGRLTFQARSRRYNASPAITLDEIGVGDQFVVNDEQLINEVTASRDGGIAYRAVNATSVGDFGTYREDITLLTTLDNEVIDAANWMVSTRSTPVARLPRLTIDLLTDATLRTDALALELGSLARVTSLPSQAPASTVDLFIEGWTETVSTQEWSMVCNTSPPGLAVFVLDDARYGLLDSGNVLAY